MKSCKKYKPAKGMAHFHHLSPVGECKSCAYFSKANCRKHANTGEIAVAPV